MENIEAKVTNLEERFLPKYRKIALFLENEIEKSFLGKKIPSDREISKKFNVSLATARQAFDYLGKKGLITRIPGQGTFVIRKSSPEAKRKLVCLILNGIHPNLEFIKAIEEEATKLGIDIILKSSDDNIEKEKKILESLDERLISGVMLWPVGTQNQNNNHVKTLFKRGMPLVLIDRYIKGINCGYVGFDNLKAGYIAARYLAGNNCKRIYFVAEPRDITSILERIDGLNRAMEEQKIKGSIIRPHIKLTPSMSYYKTLGYRAAKIFEDNEKRIDRKIGVILANELIAEGFVSYFENKFNGVPASLTIIGGSSKIDKNYVRVTLPRGQMGKKTIDCINKLIIAKAREEILQSDRIILDVNLDRGTAKK